MKERTTQRTGGGSYTVSIPLRWAEKHGIEAGDTAYIHPQDDESLLIRWDRRECGEFGEIDVRLPDVESRAVMRTLFAAYTAGFNRISLQAPTAFTSEQRRTITAFARRLIGLEVTSETDHSITTRNLLDNDDLSICQLVQQLRSVTLSTHEAMTALVAREGDGLDRITDRDNEADRIFWLVTRHFNRSLRGFTELGRLGISRSRLFEYYAAARQLVRIADHAVETVRFLRRTGHGLSEQQSPEVRSIGIRARQVVEDASDVVIDGASKSACQSVLDLSERTVQRARALDETLLDRAPEDAYVLTRVLDNFVWTAKYGGTVAEVRLRAAL